MTRTDVAVNAVARGNQPPYSVAITETTIDATLVTNGVNVPEAFNYQELQLIVYNSAVSAKTITLQAGDGVNAGIGDYTLSVASSARRLITTIDSSRFANSSTTDVPLQIDFESGFTGTIAIIGKKRGIG